MGNLDSGFLLPYAWLPLLEQLKTPTERWETLCALIDRQRYGAAFPPFEKHSLQYSICTACEPTICARLNGQKGGKAEQNEKTPSSALGEGASEANKNKNKSKNKNKKNTDSPTCDAVVEYLNRKTGKQFRKGIASTERLIRARLKEGFSEADFCTVIENKCAEWKNDPTMSRYLRPETLFGTKFDTYLNQRAGVVFPQSGDNDVLPY